MVGKFSTTFGGSLAKVKKQVLEAAQKRVRRRFDDGFIKKLREYAWWQRAWWVMMELDPTTLNVPSEGRV